MTCSGPVGTADAVFSAFSPVFVLRGLAAFGSLRGAGASAAGLLNSTTGSLRGAVAAGVAMEGGSYPGGDSRICVVVPELVVTVRVTTVRVTFGTNFSAVCFR